MGQQKMLQRLKRIAQFGLDQRHEELLSFFDCSDGWNQNDSSEDRDEALCD
jgi:hypothetical protein